ncbi:PIHD1 protein, partial [Atractosteus spatula]|nr:PIHD1 protein [Atractosteus spatula]
MDTQTDKSLLIADLEQEEELYQQFLMQAAREIQSQAPTPDTRLIRPQPGLCVKTLCSDGSKVFVNICQSAQVPPPPPLSEAELLELLQSDDPSSYRVPMSLGEPHAEMDNSSQGCTAYDVVINNEFFQKTQKDTLFLQFMIAVAFEGLENKYSIELSREWRLLKNRKFMGSIGEQNIRTRSRAAIQELDSQETETNPSQSKSECPVFRLVAEPPVGDPEYIVAEIELPRVTSARCLVLDLGEDRLVLAGRPGLYQLDCFLPWLVDPDASGAQFHTQTKVLTVTMPVVSTGSSSL